MVLTNGRQHHKVSIMRDADGLCVVKDPIHVQKLYERESGDPTIDLDCFVVKVRVENPIGVQQR